MEMKHEPSSRSRSLFLSLSLRLGLSPSLCGFAIAKVMAKRNKTRSANFMLERFLKTVLWNDCEHYFCNRCKERDALKQISSPFMGI